MIVKQLVIIANAQVVKMDTIYIDINVYNVIQIVKHVLAQLLFAKVAMMDIIYLETNAINALLHMKIV